MTARPRRTRRASPTYTNTPVTVAAPTGDPRIEQQWRDALVLKLDSQHPESINPNYTS